MKIFLTAMFAACALLGVVTAAVAQPYPSKPITLIVGTAPGGGFDLVARRLEKAMSKHLGQSATMRDIRPRRRASSPAPRLRA